MSEAVYTQDATVSPPAFHTGEADLHTRSDGASLAGHGAGLPLATLGSTSGWAKLMCGVASLVLAGAGAAGCRASQPRSSPKMDYHSVRASQDDAASANPTPPNGAGLMESQRSPMAVEDQRRGEQALSARVKVRRDDQDRPLRPPVRRPPQ